jgi:hypothetical protein
MIAAPEGIPVQRIIASGRLSQQISGMNSDGAGMLSKRMNKPLAVLALYLASAAMSAFAAVYELPADGSAVVGTDSRIRLSEQDKLFDVARRYGLGYPEIVRANPGAGADCCRRESAFNRSLGVQCAVSAR